MLASSITFSGSKIINPKSSDEPSTLSSTIPRNKCSSIVHQNLTPLTFPSSQYMPIVHSQPVISTAITASSQTGVLKMYNKLPLTPKQLAECKGIPWQETTRAMNINCFPTVTNI
ncbi:unnamed protein product [Didymodactylos carnosus]|uniref:Uncharacterized protein n=1 Tax=Didymodactylos carnosus TaxID=1234261 RepID=A0A816BZF2_9BILA|nr:unnamed protein product [Didymodactylos carnosus]CAF4502963.1 unnamed protein product [Didymodactylos carnosus]